MQVVVVYIVVQSQVAVLWWIWMRTMAFASEKWQALVDHRRQPFVSSHFSGLEPASTGPV